MYKIGENEMVLCPYNRSHVVNKLRIQKHIIKCKTHYPEVKLITCFYNYTHRLKPEEVLKHYEICSQKMRMEESRYCDNNRYSSYSSKAACDSGDAEENFTCNYHKLNSMKNVVKSSNIHDSEFKVIGSPTNSVRKNLLLSISDKDMDKEQDLKPLSLPKTVSKAFIGVKQQTGKSINLVPAFLSNGISRGRNLLIGSERLLRRSDHLLQDLKNMENCLPEKIKSETKYLISNNSNVKQSCSSSEISLLLDDDKTLKSDDVTFEDEDDKDNHNENFIFKNFDKYGYIEYDLLKLAFICKAKPV